MIEAERRIGNMVLIGRVVASDPEKARVKVKAGALQTGWLPWCSLAGVQRNWRLPQVGEQVVVICPNGEPERGLIVASLFSGDFPAPSSNPDRIKTVFADGSEATIDLSTGAMQVDCAGDLKVTVAGALTIKASALVLDGPVDVQGALNVMGETTLQATTVAGTALVPGGNLF